MDNAQYLMEKLQLKEQMPWLITDETFQILTEGKNLFRERDFFGDNSDLWQTLCARCGTQHYPVLYLEEDLFAYIALRDPAGKKNYFLGPILMGSVSRGNLWSYRKLNEYLVSDMGIISFSLDRLLRCIAILYLEITQTQIDEEAFLEENCISQGIRDLTYMDFLQFQLDNPQDQDMHHTYQSEKQFWEQFKAGLSYDEILQTTGSVVPGKIASSSFKQEEYTSVTMIALMSRYAIEAGLSPQKAYGLSDFYLQALEKCKDTLSVQNLKVNAWNSYSEAIREARRESGTPSYIAACKNYIASNLTKNIRLVDLARAVGMSSNYLSKKFKEHEGVNVGQYIIREKISAAANMLRYSDYTITEIAEYLNFVSSSHMGQCFKKEFGLSPKKYRDRYHVREFSQDASSRRETERIPPPPTGIWDPIHKYIRSAARIFRPQFLCTETVPTLFR